MLNKLFQDNIETSKLRGTAGSRPWLRQEEEKKEEKEKEVERAAARYTSFCVFFLCMHFVAKIFTNMLDARK